MSLSVNRTETKLDKSEFDIDTKLSLLMKSLTDFYTNSVYIDQIKSIIDQNSVISLRILDWFITNYSKKHRTIIDGAVGSIDVYQNYKLQLKSFSDNSNDHTDKLSPNKLPFKTLIVFLEISEEEAAEPPQLYTK